MRSARLPLLILVALLVMCFGLAAWLDLWFQSWQGNRAQSADLLNVLMGDSRRLFANHFFVKADAYFHSGFYPTVFDNREAFQTPHMAEDSGTVGGRNKGDEQGFLGKPRDWIDAFSRQLFPSRHTHLDEGGASGDLGNSSQVREIMPWLRISAELNPNDIRTYTVAAYWLRERMGKVAEAEQFLREGLRENPDSYEIMYELGRVYSENKNDQAHARNLWEAALRQWQKQVALLPDPERAYKFMFVEITSHLALLEEKQGNYPQALAYMELWKARSASPDGVQKFIDEVRRKMSSAGQPHAGEPSRSSGKAP
jgi:tetratricopeptide (TPR) repeat protein